MLITRRRCGNPTHIVLLTVGLGWMFAALGAASFLFSEYLRSAAPGAGGVLIGANSSAAGVLPQAVVGGFFFSLPFSVVCLPVSVWALSNRPLRRSFTILGLIVGMECLIAGAVIANFGASILWLGIAAITTWNVLCFWLYYATREADDLDTPVCDQCGYDLSGNLSGVCPECGRPTGELQVRDPG